MWRSTPNAARRERLLPCRLRRGEVVLDEQTVAERHAAPRRTRPRRTSRGRLAARAASASARPGRRTRAPARVACSASSPSCSREPLIEPAERGDEQRAGREPVGRQRPRRSEESLDRDAPEALVERHPAVDAPRHRDRSDVELERHRRQALGAHRCGIGSRTGAPAGIQRRDLGPARRVLAVDDGEEVAAHATQMRGRDGEDGVRGERGVDRVAAVVERCHAGRRGQMVGRRDEVVWRRARTSTAVPAIGR